MSEKIRIVDDGMLLTVCRVTFDPFDIPANFEPLILDASSLSDLTSLITAIVAAIKEPPIKAGEFQT
jgi:hypothetical protein